MSALRDELKAAVLEALFESKPTQVVIMPDSHSWSVRECAEYLGISQSHLRNLISEELIPFFRVGKRIQFHPHKIRNWEGTEEGRPGRMKIAERAVELELQNRKPKRRAQ